MGQLEYVPLQCSEHRMHALAPSLCDSTEISIEWSVYLGGAIQSSSSLILSGDIVGLDSLIANIYGIWSSDDSVVVTLDIIFNIEHCRIYPVAR
ncbi:hypothetical protein DRQ29_06050 [bacterium]|nr:MAG: hypothetical protein DRQ29_06050 [bacterium]